MSVERNKIIFVSGTTYPNGLASTNRIKGLLRELSGNCWVAKAYCLSATKYPTGYEGAHPQFRKEGTDEGVEYYYLPINVRESKYRILRTVNNLAGLILLPFILISREGKPKFGRAILATNITSIFHVLYFKVISLIINHKLVLIRSEFPNIVQHRSRVKYFLYRTLFEKWYFKLFNGYVLMTRTLKEYFSVYARKDSKLEIIPMTVDLNRFNSFQESPFPFEYIAYAGSLSSKKDGLDILLKAFIKLAHKNPKINLAIAGDKNDSSAYSYLLGIVNNEAEHIKGRIHFVGRIDSNDIPSFLKNAKALALARPRSLQAEGGFPTKLGEYLATGKPVIVTNVGEIPDYLQHKKNAILCSSDDVDSFADGLEWVINNYPEATKIGIEGRLLSEQVFSAKVQGEKLSNFLKSL
ncbi:Glycosyl transferases group 1 [anaerobic digester metagenome]